MAEFGSGNIKEFQLSIIYHTCGTVNTIVRCSGCGRFMDIVHEHCYNCGLILDQDGGKASPAHDEVVLDYNGCPPATETYSVLDYLAVMVREVKDRAEQMNFGQISFEFRMTSEMWSSISDLYMAWCITAHDKYACMPKDGGQNAAKLKAKQSVFVDGAEYSVELDEDCDNDIFFVPIIGEFLPRMLTAVLKNVGVGREKLYPEVVIRCEQCSKWVRFSSGIERIVCPFCGLTTTRETRRNSHRGRYG